MRPSYRAMVIIASFWTMAAVADTVQLTVYKIIPNSNTSNVTLGNITFTDTPYGLLINAGFKYVATGNSWDAYP